MENTARFDEPDKRRQTWSKQYRHHLGGFVGEEAVEWNISNGGIVRQTRAVLEADVTHEMTYNDEVSVDEQARFSSEAAAKLDLVASQDSTNRISGRRLFYGIKLAPDAFTLKTPDAKPTKCLRY